MKVKLPKVNALTINPNPAQTKAVIIIAAEITEIEKELSPEIIYSGEIYAGEEFNG